MVKRKNNKCGVSNSRKQQNVLVVPSTVSDVVPSTGSDVVPSTGSDVDVNGFTGKQREYLKALKDFYIPFTFSKLSDPLIENINEIEDVLHTTNEENKQLKSDLHSMREENKRLKSDLYAKLEGKQGKWLDGLYGRMRDAFYTKEDVSDYVEDCLKDKDGEIAVLKERLKNIEMRLPPMSPSSPPSSFMIPCSPISPNTPLSQLSAPKSPPMRFNNKPLPIFVKKVDMPTVTKNPLPPIRFA